MRNQLRKLGLLLWKNYLMERRRPLVLVAEFILPLVIPIVLILVRSTINVTVIPDSTQFDSAPVNFPPFQFSLIEQLVERSGFDCPNLTLAYTPDYDETTAFINATANRLPCIISNLQGYATEEEMNDDLGIKGSDNHTLCGVVLKRSPNETTYDLRFPYKLRMAVFDSTWMTELLYPNVIPNGPRMGAVPVIRFNISELGFDIKFNSRDVGGLPSYYLEGFLAVQAAIDLTIMDGLGMDTSSISLESRRMSYPPYTSDNFVTVIQNALALIFLLCMVFISFNIVKALVVEKEKRLKESMKIMGLENYLHWTAWFIQYFIITFVVSCLTTVCMCVAFAQYKVLPYSDWTVILVFVTIYGTSSMMFCFFLSTLFSKANSAAVIATLLWFVSFFPWTIASSRYAQMTRGAKLAQSLFCNSGMGLGSYLIGQYEASGVGAQWNIIHKPVNIDDNVSLLSVFLMLIGDCFIYGILTWYVEAVFPGQYGYPQPFYFFVLPSYWTGNSKTGYVQTNQKADCNEEYIESDAGGIAVGVEIKGLRKTFGLKTAVHNLNLNIYEEQITVLLGHNGAGKSTTMSMLTGLFPPTSGTAIVNHYQLSGQLGKIRESLGLCPQHDVLFDNLTVEEHLIFFGTLKGAERNRIKTQMHEYLGQLGLSDKITSLSNTLSGGMKRKLSVAIALVGDSKIVILDEPTSGMDPAARRLTWDVLLKNKPGRTLLLSTHFMDEADVLGDRIAIMADGKLQCCGSSMFLKNKYGVGYKLSIVKSSSCEVKNIQELIQKTIPGSYIEREVGSELVFTLPTEHLKNFPQLFTSLENEKPTLGIDSYGVSVTTIEEVFLQVGKLHEDALTDENPRLTMTRQGSILASPLIRETSTDNLVDNPRGDYGTRGGDYGTTKVDALGDLHYNSVNKEKNSGITLYYQQLRAMVKKRMLYTFRNKKLAIFQILIPAFCVVVSLLVIKFIPSVLAVRQRNILLDQYQETVSYVSNSDPIYKNAYKAYTEQINKNSYPGSSVLEVTDVDTAIIDASIKSVGEYNTKIMIAAEFGSKITIWFNNQAFHTAPLSLNMITNALIQGAGINHQISVINSPLPATFTDTANAIETGAALWQGFNTAFNISIGFAFLVASFAIFPVKERTNRAKHVQYVSGLQASIFWISAFLWDICNFLLACVVLIILFLIFQVDAFTGARLLWISIIFCEYSIAALPLTYCCSFLFEDSTSAFLRVTTINIILSIGTMLTVVILRTPGVDKAGLSDVLGWIFLIFIPQYCLPNSLVDIYTNYEANQACEQEGLTPKQCTIVFPGLASPSYISWERPGVSSYMVFYLVHSVTWWTVLICIESNFVATIKNTISTLKARVDENMYTELNNETVQDEDVIREKEAVIGLSRNEQNTLVVSGLSKSYFQNDNSCCGPCSQVRVTTAVQQMYLKVKQEECFGLLGINGAGKTTTFKMLTGDISMSSGTAYVTGIDISRNLRQAQQQMGYCPQFDALIDQMTGRETLEMYARLRGLKEETINDCVEELIVVLDLTKHADKLTMNYSGGNKRKLSTGVALIGCPPLVFLDEPTTGMDPAARRNLWNVISRLIQKGLSVILTSHSMEECEFLCQRLAIMVNGQFQCLGSPQHLKSRFGKGFTLIAKLEYEEGDGVRRKFSEFIDEYFPGSTLKDEHQMMVHYHVNNENIKWAHIFQMMEQHKTTLRVVDYSVSQTTLEQVFLNFAKNQAQ